MLLVFEDLAVKRNRDDLPGDELAAFLQRFLRRKFESATAGDFHADDGHGPDVVRADDLPELFRIVDLIELRASDERDLAAHEFLV